MHYWRWRTHGDPEANVRPRHATLEESFLGRTERRGDCLIWTGAKSRGYGVLEVGGVRAQTHRYAWERAFGPIPDGIMIDHQFHCNTACCEINHLRMATHRQNNLNRNGPSSLSKSGVRGVFVERHGFRVRLVVDGVRRGGWHPTLEAAEAEAEHINQASGEFAGTIRKVERNFGPDTPAANAGQQDKASN